MDAYRRIFDEVASGRLHLKGRIHAVRVGSVSRTQSRELLIYDPSYTNNMATAYVLINCELGSEEAIIRQLKSLDGVIEVHGTFGAYDILAKIESETVEKLRETITWKIRKIEKIRSTLTLMGIEGQS